MIDVVGAPHGLARQRQRAEAYLGRTLHFLDGPLEVCRRNGGHGGEAIVVGAELLPRPLVEHAALRLREDRVWRGPHGQADRKSTRLNSSHVKISYAVFCLKKKKKTTTSCKKPSRKQTKDRSC